LTCIVEASCGYGGEYSGTAASLSYGTITVLSTGTVNIPNELNTGTVTINYTDLSQLQTLLNDEDTNNGDTFVNYQLIGNTLEWRV
jgi:glutamate-1-semialdehyde aminotransferase